MGKGSSVTRHDSASQDARKKFVGCCVGVASLTDMGSDRHRETACLGANGQAVSAAAKPVRGSVLCLLGSSLDAEKGSRTSASDVLIRSAKRLPLFWKGEMPLRSPSQRPCLFKGRC